MSCATIPVRAHELIVEYGGELVTIKHIAEQTGIDPKYLRCLRERGQLSVSRVLEYQRRMRVREIARANGVSYRQVQSRLMGGWSPVDAATRPVRSYSRRARKESAV